MIVEERCYTLKPGTVHVLYKDYEARGLKVQTRILGNLIGYFHTEIGPLNHIVHLWGYADLNDRAERRGRLAADPAWQAFLVKLTETLDTLENRILVPTDFSPLR